MVVTDGCLLYFSLSDGFTWTVRGRRVLTLTPRCRMGTPAECVSKFKRRAGTISPSAVRSLRSLTQSQSRVSTCLSALDTHLMFLLAWQLAVLEGCYRKMSFILYYSRGNTILKCIFVGFLRLGNLGVVTYCLTQRPCLHQLLTSVSG